MASSTIKKSRGVIRAATTRMIGDLEKIVEENKVEQVADALAKLSVKKVKLCELDKLILEGLDDDEEIENDVSTSLEYEELITIWEFRLLKISSPVNPTSAVTPQVLQPMPSNVSIISEIGASSANGSHSKHRVRLPKLEIKKFDGNVENWGPFWESFLAAVDSNDDLSKVEKFNYLRTLVSEKAAKCIQGLALTEANYEVAIELLKERFGQNELIVDVTLKSLAKVTAPKNDAVGLRGFYDEIEVKIRSLNALGVDVKLYEGWLCPVILRSLPREILLEWTDKRKEADWEEIAPLLDFLKTEVKRRERVARYQVDAVKKDEVKNDKPVKGSSSTAALSVASKENIKSLSQKESEFGCWICGDKGHGSSNCTVKNVKERLEKLRKRGRCFNCIREIHLARDCNKEKAKCGTCGKGHHSWLCYQIEEREPEKEKETDKEKVEAPVMVSSNQVVRNLEKELVLLQTATVLVEGTIGKKLVRCLIDGGSQSSFISKKLVEEIGAPKIGHGDLSINGFGQENERSTLHNRVVIKMSAASGTNQVDIVMWDHDTICSSYTILPGEWIREEMKRKGRELADLTTEGEHRPIEILIGADTYWSVVTGRFERLSEHLAAVETLFGWVVQGPTEVENVIAAHAQVNIMHTCINGQKEFEEEVREFWSMEGSGLGSLEDTAEECEVLKTFEDTIVKTEDRYQVQLPWNNLKGRLNTNWGEACKRFYLTIRRMKKKGLLQAYMDAMMAYVKDGHAEAVKADEEPGETVYYIPHQAVIRDDRDTMKMRIVFDASSGEPSLNDCLHAGPHLNPDVLELLLQFRQFPIALTADMEKAFLQVELAHEDRDAARFIWLPENWTENDLIEPQIYRMKRVLFGLNCGPFLLSATIKHHLKPFEEIFPATVKALEDNIYVDDLVTSVMTQEDGQRLYQEGKNIISGAGLNLRKWASNSRELREYIGKHETMAGVKAEFALNLKLEEASILGMKWSQKEDFLFFNPKNLLAFLKEQPPTKRTVLRAMARIFDPMGLVAPFTVRLKCLFQTLWKIGISWDEKLPANEEKIWIAWISELPDIMKIKVPRWILDTGNTNQEELELHVFCDASEKAYGAVIYIGMAEGFRLVASKNKIVPMKAITIPRLELMGALVGVRLWKTVKKTLKCNAMQTTFWTDSMVALHWIKGKAEQWKPFVGNRVREIQGETVLDAWKHIGTEVNPADKLTRGMKVVDLIVDKNWWYGSPNMCEDDCLMSGEIENWVKDEQRRTEVVQVVLAENQDIFDVWKFSTWQKLVRTVGWVRRFLSNCRSAGLTGPLSAEEMIEAERMTLKGEQRRHFLNEIQALDQGNDIGRTSKILKFDPRLGEDGLLRLGGRLQFSGLEWDAKHPIILENDSMVTRLVIEATHRRLLHGGVQETLTQLREQFWIIRGRQAVKKVLKNCLECQKRRVKAVQPIEGPLPEERTTVAEPFEVVGLDYAGPLWIKRSKKVQEKCYVLLITCAVTRAVHLELVQSMNVDDFLMAFRRFLARRGACQVIWSDNFRTFKRAKKDLDHWHKMLNSKKTRVFIAEQRIRWKFIADRAPWWGGFWERLVKLVKDKLKAACGRALLNETEMVTILTEVEGILNSRPLEYVPEDGGLILTPAHLIVGRRLTALPPSTASAEQLSGKLDVGKRWRVRLGVLQQFWKHWVRGYLSFLRGAQERKQGNQKKEVEVGDIVTLDDEKTARHLWKMCRVHETLKGRDGVVRSCFVKTPDGKLLKRPVQLLYPLELKI